MLNNHKSKFEFNNNLKDSYLTLSMDSEVLIDYQYRMLDKFQIPHILGLSSLYEDNLQIQYYHINDMDSLSFCLKNHAYTYQLISKLINNLLECVVACKTYLLEEERLDLCPDFIFYHRLEETFYFMYRPILNQQESVKNQCFKLFDYLLTHVGSSDQKAVNLCHRLRIAAENERLNTQEVEMIMEDIENQVSTNLIRMKPVTKQESKHKKSSFLSKFFGIDNKGRSLHGAE